MYIRHKYLCFAYICHYSLVQEIELFYAVKYIKKLKILGGQGIGKL